MKAIASRFRFWFLVAGVFIVFWGVEELRLADGASKEPQAADLLKMEKGGEAPNSHLLVGEHMSLFPMAVYSYSRKKGESGPIQPEQKVDYTYYPIISRGHAFVAEVGAWAQKYPAGTEIPDDVEDPQPESFKMLVKSKRFATVNDIPDDYQLEASVKGMLINKIASLTDDEKKLIQESFPKADLGSVLILEEGRKPTSLFDGFMMVVGGLALCLLALYFFWDARREGKVAAVA